MEFTALYLESPFHGHNFLIAALLISLKKQHFGQLFELLY